MIRQRTLKNKIRALGVGVHTGKKVSLTLCPAPPDTGIIFRRVDLNDPIDIPGRVDYVSNTVLSTEIAKGEKKVATVEHLLSALSGLGIDNLLIELTGEEVPIMDGSAGSFVFLIQSAGIKIQKPLKRFIRIKKPIQVIDQEKRAALCPYPGFQIAMHLDFDHPVLKSSEQEMQIDISSTTYIKEISRARTFGFISQFDYLRKRKLILGGSLKNAIVLDKQKVVNEEGLRLPNEFVMHKVLDAVGDLYLLGHTLIGRFSGYKSGHSINNLLLKKLLNSPEAWEIATFKKEEDCPISFCGSD